MLSWLERVHWVGESWSCPLFFKLTASSGTCLIAQSQSPIGQKPSRRQVLCAQSDRWQAQALILAQSPQDCSLSPSFRQWSQFPIFLTSNYSQGLAQVLCLASHHCARTLSMMVQYPNRYRGDPQVIAPSRSSSLRHTTSMLDHGGRVQIYTAMGRRHATQIRLQSGSHWQGITCHCLKADPHSDVMLSLHHLLVLTVMALTFSPSFNVQRSWAACPVAQINHHVHIPLFRHCL